MAYDNHYIVNWMEADKELALRLDRALTGVKDEMLEKGQQLSDAFTRATWYTSCLTDNYQDVCTRLGNEDVRFVKGLIELVKRRDIIFVLIRLYVETYLKNESEDKVTNIARALSKMRAYRQRCPDKSRPYFCCSTVNCTFILTDFPFCT